MSALLALSGKINVDACFYCLDCQVVYYDAYVCPPRVAERKHGERAHEPSVAEPATA